MLGGCVLGGGVLGGCWAGAVSSQGGATVDDGAVLESRRHVRDAFSDEGLYLRGIRCACQQPAVVRSGYVLRAAGERVHAREIMSDSGVWRRRVREKRGGGWKRWLRERENALHETYLTRSRWRLQQPAPASGPTDTMSRKNCSLPRMIRRQIYHSYI